MRGRVARLTAAFQALLLMATLVLPALASATVWTDQADYSPGSVVTISGDNGNGAGYVAGETVDVAVSGPNGYTAACSATVDDAGAWSCQVTLWGSELAVGAYSYTAIGLLSGTTEAGAFTDAAVVSIDNNNPNANDRPQIRTIGGILSVSVTGENTCTTSGSPTQRCHSEVSVSVQIFPDGSGTPVGPAKATTLNTPTAADWAVSFTFPADSTGGSTIPADGLYDVIATYTWNVCSTSACTATSSTATTSTTSDKHFAIDNTPPPAPTVTGTSPSSPANENNPDVDGNSNTNGITVKIYTDSTCTALAATGTSLGSGSFSIPVTVPDDSTTAFWAAAVDAAGNSACSTTSTTYVEDSSAPATPTVDSTSPSSPNPDTTPTVNGTAEPGSTVRLFRDAACTNPESIGTASGGGTYAIDANVLTNATETYWARSTDLSGNQSACSTTSVSYTASSANTAPSVVVTGVVDGGSYNKGSVPAAECSVTDVEDGNGTFSATLSSITGPDAAFGIGSQTASCEYTDGGGLSDDASATYDITDGTGPEISYVLTPTVPDGDNGWFLGPVTLVWTVSEVDSPSTLSLTGCVDQNLTADQASTDYSCEATSAGGSAGPVTVSIKIDGTAPTATVNIDDTPNGAGWFKSTVGFTTTGTDNLSDIASCTDAADYSGPDSATATSATATCTDNAGNVSATDVSDVFKYDATAPVITDDGPTAAANGSGWYNADVTNGFSVDADISGPDAACAAAFPGGSQTKTTTGEGLAVTVTSDDCTDLAGNTATGVTSSAFQIDQTAPTAVTFGATGLADGGSYYFGFVPAGPATCSADYDISGSDGCVVSGYSGVVGPHTVQAAATDLAGNVGYAYLNYTVLAWELSGFYNPVNMGMVLNTVKAGSTVPLKFEIFAGATELTSTSYVTGFQITSIACGVFIFTPSDDVEMTSTGGTTLRYDSTGGQFIQNWQTPKSKAGNCYVVTLNTLDGGSLTAFFKLK